MDTADRIERLFAEVVREAKLRPTFAAQLRAAWEASSQQATITESGHETPLTSSRARTTRLHRRTPAVLDPLAIHQQGEDHLRAALVTLTVDQLKDIVAEHGMDTNKLAMKWRTRERLEELIVTTVRERMAKGSVFRRSP